MNILITGMAGFIGHAVAKRLAAEGHDIVGIDNLNDYYDVSLKQARLDDLAGWPNVRFECLDLADRAGMERLFADTRFERVIHLAAQAGVRYSLDNPHVYAQSNLVGHLNVLEGCRHQQVPHLIYASSSSVYGQNAQVPFSTADAVDHPISLYAATKKANELMTHSYSHLYGIPATGLRFFTVYGPWGRPDMAMFKFTRAFSRTSRCRCSTMAICPGISPISTISSRGSCASCRRFPRPTPTVRAHAPIRARRPSRCTISGMAARWP